MPQLALERDGTGALLRRYIYGNDRISMVTPATTSYYHYDRLGSVANTTSAVGSTERTYDYEPFGDARSELSNGTPPTNVHKFAGELQDATGLYHLRARQYESTTGRFLTRDPLDDSLATPPGGAYQYAEQRPTVLTDPAGEFAIEGAGRRAISRISAAASPTAWRCPAVGLNVTTYAFDSGWRSMPFFGGVGPDNKGRDKGGFTGASLLVRLSGRAHKTSFVPTGTANTCIELGIEWNFSRLSNLDGGFLTLKRAFKAGSSVGDEKPFCGLSREALLHRVNHDGGPGCVRQIQFVAGGMGLKFYPSAVTRTQGITRQGSIPASQNVEFYGLKADEEPGRVAVVANVSRSGYGPMYTRHPFAFDRTLRCDLRRGRSVQC